MYEYFTAYDPLIVFGLLSALLSSFAFLPYIRDTLSGQTRPQRAAWLIWSVLGAIAFFSQVFEGADASLWFAGAQVSGTIVVFLLSIRNGVGGYVNKWDIAVLLAAGIGLVAWALCDTAVYALMITIGISMMGGAVTVMKAYAKPHSETLATWLLSFIASFFAILSVGHMDWVLMAYPLYLLVLNGAIVLAILLGYRQRRALSAPTTTAFPAE